MDNNYLNNIPQEEALTKSRIMNINDFIFRQNMEFYPNLYGLIVENNILKLIENNNVIASESLTFDLRTLPGDAWLTTPYKFIDIIRINKTIKALENLFSLFQTNNNIDNGQIKNGMNLYFHAKDYYDYLTDYNKTIVNNFENIIASLKEDSPLGIYVNQKLDEYLAQSKESGNAKGKGMILELKNKQFPSVIDEEEPNIPKAGFINIFILIYGMINIALIIALALIHLK